MIRPCRKVIACKRSLSVHVEKKQIDLMNKFGDFSMHSSPSPDSSAQQSPDTGSPATPGTRNPSITVASPPMLISGANNMPRFPSNVTHNHLLTPQNASNAGVGGAAGVSAGAHNPPGGSLPDLSSSGIMYPQGRELLHGRNDVRFAHSDVNPAIMSSLGVGPDGQFQMMPLSMTSMGPVGSNVAANMTPSGYMTNFMSEHPLNNQMDDG